MKYFVSLLPAYGTARISKNTRTGLMMAINTLPSSPTELRNLIRNGGYNTITAGLAPGYVQTNLVILPRDLAFDFLLFCQRNPKPCPLIEVIESGNIEPKLTAPGADIRTDLPKYRVYRDGVLDKEVENVLDVWRDDLVSFLLGCGFTFESALMSSGIEMRHIEDATNVSMYITNIETVPAGKFSGPTVVSMRPIKQEKVVKAVQVTSRFPNTHGSPLHIGNPASLGIKDIEQPDYGDIVPVKEGEVPVFWACGVTPQAVAAQSKPPFMITHSPGHMFITDIRDEDLALL